MNNTESFFTKIKRNISTENKYTDNFLFGYLSKRNKIISRILLVLLFCFIPEDYYEENPFLNFNFDLLFFFPVFGIIFLISLISWMIKKYFFNSETAHFKLINISDISPLNSTNRVIFLTLLIITLFVSSIDYFMYRSFDLLKLINFLFITFSTVVVFRLIPSLYYLKNNFSNIRFNIFTFLIIGFLLFFRHPFSEWVKTFLFI